MNNKGCQSDFDDLLSLANECIEQSPGFEEYLKDWLADMAELRKIQNLETLEIEQNLEQLSWILRYQWLRFASQYSHRILKSPIIGPYEATVSGAKFRFPYDRWLKPKYLEKRCNDYHPTPDGWHGEHLLFASGMSAANAAIQYSRTRLSHLPELHLYEFGGFFEYERLFRYTSDEKFIAEICKDHESLINIVKNSEADILMIEPVAALWPMEVFDIQKFKEAWYSAEKVPASLIIDTSPIGCVFPMKEFLNLLSARPPMVMEVSSGLKLDQAGLDLANVGILSMYLPERVSFKRRHSRLKMLARMRRTFGLSATFNELSTLEFPAFLNRSRQLKHTKSVYANNALFAKSMNQIGKGIFTEIAHPALSKNTSSWAGAPFVLMRLQGEEEEDRKLMKDILRKEAEERGLCFNKGSSFGFRSHRFEMGIGGAPGSTGIRIALGSRSGPSLHGLIELFNHLGTYKNFSALRAVHSKKEGGEYHCENAF